MLCTIPFKNFLSFRMDLKIKIRMENKRQYFSLYLNARLGGVGVQNEPLQDVPQWSTNLI